MTRIVVTGVDNSETAAIAAQKAASLANDMGARLHVLSAYGTFESERINIGSDEILVSNEQEAEAVARDVFLEIRREFPTLEITFAPGKGSPGEALVNAAEHLDADVIVVGNKRVQGVARVLGSVARDVAAHAHCDVYVAHTHHRN